MRSFWVWALAAGWTVASFAAWTATLWLLDKHGNLDTDSALSAAQVFTGVAGFGAAVVALVALQQQLRPPRAKLVMQTDFSPRDLVVRVKVKNAGPVAAEGVRLTFVGAHTVECKTGLEGWTTKHPAGEFVYLERAAPLPAFSEFVDVTLSDLIYPNTLRAIRLSCANGTGVEVALPTA